MHQGNGPTQLLPSSHLLLYQEKEQKEGLPSYSATPALSATLPLGAALLFDSRTLHRGLANPSQLSRPCLVWQYDSPLTPPPGHTLVSTALVRLAGFVLCVALELRAILAS